MKIKNIIFDFDGVIIDSMNIREYGFREIFSKYPKDKIDKLIDYHRINGGLSRFNKIKYFYNNILLEDISDYKIENYAKEFSNIMRHNLIHKNNLIEDCINFISNNYKLYNMHIASGSEHNELNYLCEKLGISKFFRSIDGSPRKKIDIVRYIIASNCYNKEETILIGDSINDYDASKYNNIKFYAYNNIKLKEISDYYIESLSEDTMITKRG